MRNGHLARLLMALLLVLTILTLTTGHSHHRVLGAETEVVPPTAPLAISAKVGDRGVAVSWQPSEDGTFSVHSYQIYRQNANGQFNQIGEVNSDTTQYVDSEGKDGSIYRFASTDDQQPADTSAYSDEITATAPATNPAVAEAAPITPSSIDNLPPTQVSSDFQATDLPSNVKPTEAAANSLQDITKSFESLRVNSSQGLNVSKVEQIQKTTNIQVAQLQTAIAKSQDDLVQPVLSQYTYGLRLLYQNFNKLPPAQKTTTVQTCEQQTNNLETSLPSLTERYQMNLLIALAQCHLIHKQL